MVRKLPSACVLCLLFLLLSEGFVRYHWSQYLPTADYVLLHKKKHWEDVRNPDYDGIILGDSLSHGLDPRVIGGIIARETGQAFSLYNYSFPHADVRSYYLVLRKYLSLGKRPRVIFFESMPLAMHGAWKMTRNPKGLPDECHRFFSLFSPWDYAAVVPARFLFQTWKMALERASFLLTYRAYICDYLRYRVLTRHPRMMERAELDTQGRALMNVERKVAPEEIRNWFNYQMEFSADGDTLGWYQRFFALAREYDIRIMIFNTPFIDEVFQKREKNGFHRQYQQVMTALVQGFDNVTILQPVCESFDQRYFLDPSHMNDQGNELFSSILGNRLAQHLKTPGPGIWGI
jgi:hypothetical protein